MVFVVTCLTVGGAQVALHQLLTRANRRFEAHVISLQEVDEVGRRIEQLGIPVEGLGMKPGSPNPLAVIGLARRLRALNPDVVQTWMYHADLVGGISARLAGLRAPVAWCIHHSNLSPSVNKRSTLLVVKACARLSAWIPRRIVFCSEAARQVHVAAGYHRDKAMVIPNGIDTGRFVPDAQARTTLRRELLIPDDAKLVGLVARFDPIKNHEGFVRVAAMLAAKLPACHFILAGAGVDMRNRQLTGWIEQAGLGSKIHLLGERQDMPRLIAALDLLALTSWGEALPTVVAEAMSCGVPCVVTDVGEAGNMVGDAGRIVAPGDDVAFAQACQTLLALGIEARRDLEERARKRVKTHFELENMACAYEGLYHGLADESGKSSA